MSIGIIAANRRRGGGGTPSAYRYYRLYMTSVASPSGSIYLALTELALYETSGGPNYATSGTATASSDGFGWVPSNINNGVAGAGMAGWHSASGTFPEWVMIDLGAGNEKALYSYTIWARDGREDQCPGDWLMEGSNDGSTFTTVDSRSGWTVTMWQTGGTPSPWPQTFIV